MDITPVAIFHSPFSSKFGIPKQSGVVKSLKGRIVFLPQYRSTIAIRGMEGFDYLWLIWGFSANKHAGDSLTVRPPRLGGNRRMGVFATRSPYRPNSLGLSSVRLTGVDYEAPEAPVLLVEGGDLMDGTPIYDIKPYLSYCDSHPEAKGGFTDTTTWPRLKVFVPEMLAQLFTADELAALKEVLAQDPRPSYQNNPTRQYGMVFAGRDIRFVVNNEGVQVVEVLRQTHF